MAIKFRTLGCIDVAKNNPVLTHTANVVNNSIVTKDGATYLVWNEINGDESYLKDQVIKAGDFLNGYNLSANIDQELVMTADFINETIANLTAGDAVTVKSAYVVGTPVVAFSFVEAAPWDMYGKAAVVKIAAVE